MRCTSPGVGARPRSVGTNSGEPYEYADSLGDADDTETLLEARTLLDNLGAKPQAAMVRAKLSARGLRRIPRDPRRTTRLNPAGLAVGQSEVLQLLRRRHLPRDRSSPLPLAKTIDHQRTAVRTKLGVSTREAAVNTAREMGLLPSQADTSL